MKLTHHSSLITRYSLLPTTNYNVAIVICRELPLEEQYYPWLLFAPANSPKWKNLVRRLYKEGQHELLRSAIDMRPKEAEVLINELLEQAKADMTPEERAAWERNQEEAEKVLQRLAQKLSPKARLLGLTVEERLEGISPEKLLEKVSPEQIADSLSPEQLEALQKLLAQRKTRKKK